MEMTETAESAQAREREESAERPDVGSILANLDGEGFTDSQFLAMTAFGVGNEILRTDLYIAAALCPWRKRPERKRRMRQLYLAGHAGGDVRPFEYWWETMEYLYMLDPTELAVRREEREEKKAGMSGRDFSAMDLEELLYSWDIGIRMNVISHEVEVTFPPELRKLIGTRLSPDSVISQIWNYVMEEGVSVGRDRIRHHIGLIADWHSYNPVEDLLKAAVWDGVSRKAELERAMGIPEEDGISRMLLEKWLLQSVAMALNDEERPYGADGVLVLNGPQGVGKTSLVRMLGLRPDLCRCGLSVDPRNRDELKRCTSAWLVELGEIESTMRKADLDRLKSFVTEARDVYRLPYATSEQSVERRTSMVGTCNSEEFLLDETGNRRFWVVPVSGMDLEALKRMDFLQLWAEIYAEYAAPGVDRRECFRLTSEERALLETRNANYRRKPRAYIEVGDVLASAEGSDEYVMRPMTVTAFMEQHNCLMKYNAAAVGMALKAHGIPRIEPKRSYGWTYMLPCRRRCPNGL